MEPVQLEVWSDIACPWCYIGRRNLSVVLEDITEAERPVVTWHAYQLDPTVPADGLDIDEYYAKRFPDRSVLEEARERLIAMGEELGINYRFDRQRVAPNTRLAHQIIAASKPHDVQELVLDALFAGYFEQGVDVSDKNLIQELLADALGDAALAEQIIEAAQSDSQYADSVDLDLKTAQELGITGVPCFVADRAIAVPGAVPPPVLGQLIAKANERREQDELSALGNS